MSTEIKSEIFDKDTTYAIFIHRKAAPFFAEKIKDRQWNNHAVEILNANFDNELSVIVIPIHQDFKNIEKVLFDFKLQHEDEEVKKSGFWGQFGIGYNGKTWSV